MSGSGTTWHGKGVGGANGWHSTPSMRPKVHAVVRAYETPELRNYTIRYMAASTEKRKRMDRRRELYVKTGLTSRERRAKYTEKCARRKARRQHMLVAAPMGDPRDWFPIAEQLPPFPGSKATPEPAFDLGEDPDFFFDDHDLGEEDGQARAGDLAGEDEAQMGGGFDFGGQQWPQGGFGQAFGGGFEMGAQEGPFDYGELPVQGPLAWISGAPADGPKAEEADLFNPDGPCSVSPELGEPLRVPRPISPKLGDLAPVARRPRELGSSGLFLQPSGSSSSSQRDFYGREASDRVSASPAPSTSSSRLASMGRIRRLTPQEIEQEKGAERKRLTEATAAAEGERASKRAKLAQEALERVNLRHSARHSARGSAPPASSRRSRPALPASRQPIRSSRAQPDACERVFERFEQQEAEVRQRRRRCAQVLVLCRFT
ncbi:hypothetical protein JCM11641_007980 [Rhodosporidiobolus odoratus]